MGDVGRDHRVEVVVAAADREERRDRGRRRDERALRSGRATQAVGEHREVLAHQRDHGVRAVADDLRARLAQRRHPQRVARPVQPRERLVAQARVLQRRAAHEPVAIAVRDEHLPIRADADATPRVVRPHAGVDQTLGLRRRPDRHAHVADVPHDRARPEVEVARDARLRREALLDPPAIVRRGAQETRERTIREATSAKVGRSSVRAAVVRATVERRARVGRRIDRGVGRAPEGERDEEGQRRREMRGHGSVVAIDAETATTRRRKRPLQRTRRVARALTAWARPRPPRRSSERRGLRGALQSSNGAGKPRELAGWWHITHANGPLELMLMNGLWVSPASA